MEGYDYMVLTTSLTREDLDHWFRYLSKCFSDGQNHISQETFQALWESEDLRPFQKVSLKRAMVKDSPTRAYVLGLTQARKTRLLDSFKENVKEEEGEFLKLLKTRDPYEKASLVLDGLAKDHGLTWLEDYYIKNVEGQLEEILFLDRSKA